MPFVCAMDHKDAFCRMQNNLVSMLRLYFTPNINATFEKQYIFGLNTL